MTLEIYGLTMSYYQSVGIALDAKGASSKDVAEENTEDAHQAAEEDPSS